jgi:hypothetical protein
MAVNLRGKIDTFESKDAGNYQCGILLDSQSYGSPSCLRKALQNGAPFSEMEAPLPSSLELLFSRKCAMSLITSWIFPSFDGEMTFAPCASSTATAPPAACSLRYHMPCPGGTGFYWKLCTVFRPCKGRLAVYIETPDSTCADLTGEGSPLGERFLPAVFSGPGTMA